MHDLEVNGFRWPNRKSGPWEIKTTVAIVGGRWELVGLTIQPIGIEVDVRAPGFVDSPFPLTSTVLKQLHVPELFAEHRKRSAIADESTAHNRGFRIELHGRTLTADEAERYLKSQSSAAPHPGRPTHWNPAQLAQVAHVYREAWSARKPPTAAVASRFHLTTSGAAKVVRLARANGLLPLTTRGRPGLTEMPQQKGRKPKETS